MAERKLNLRLPSFTSESFEKSQLGRPSSRTDQLVDSSFGLEVQKRESTPKSSTLGSCKFVPANSSLKELLKKTTDKLKGLENREYGTSPNSNEKNNEILRLKREVRILEMEKKELEIENKKLSDSLIRAKKISEAPVSSQSTLLRYSKFFLLRIKEQQSWLSAFKETFDTENEFLNKIQNENLLDVVTGLFQLILEILPTLKSYSPSLSPSINHKDDLTSNFNTILKIQENKDPRIKDSDEDYNKIYQDTRNLQEFISKQKQKIERVYGSIKDSVKITRNISSSPRLSRPDSSSFGVKRASPSIIKRYDSLEPQSSSSKQNNLKL